MTQYCVRGSVIELELQMARKLANLCNNVIWKALEQKNQRITYIFDVISFTSRLEVGDLVNALYDCSCDAVHRALVFQRAVLITHLILMTLNTILLILIPGYTPAFYIIFGFALLLTMGLLLLFEFLSRKERKFIEAYEIFSRDFLVEALIDMYRSGGDKHAIVQKGQKGADHGRESE